MPATKPGANSRHVSRERSGGFGVAAVARAGRWVKGASHCGPNVSTVSCDHGGQHPRECARARGKEKPLKRFHLLSARHTPN